MHLILEKNLDCPFPNRMLSVKVGVKPEKNLDKVDFCMISHNFIQTMTQQIAQ